MKNSGQDMLVKLYELPDVTDLKKKLEKSGIVIRRALAPEKSVLLTWMRQKYPFWVDECDVAFTSHPVRCLIATSRESLAGVSIFDAIALGVAGPLGIDPAQRAQGIGKVLFTETLHLMRACGYAYAVLGWIPVEAQPFYKKVVNAEIIENTNPNGMYAGMLRRLP